MESNNNQITRFGQWLNESLTVKLVAIFFLTLALLIPSSLISDLVRERQYRQSEVTAEVSASWSGPQFIAGPVLMLPYMKEMRILRQGTELTETQIHYLYLLPELVQIQMDTDTRLLSRGIFDVAVYESNATVSGHFGRANLEREELLPEQILWDKARMVLGVGDLRGVKEVSDIKVGESEYSLDEFAREKVFEHNLVVSPALSKAGWESLPFEFALDMRGTSQMQFLQLAKQTDVKLTGNWTSPKFVGQSLPDQRLVSDDDFEAFWSLRNFARSLPQQWTGGESTILGHDMQFDPHLAGKSAPTVSMADGGSSVHYVDAFGVEFLQPVNHYHKSERAVKYAILIIILTFLALFFTEIIAKKRIHLVQYVLIGAAMMVFYALLLAFSEHVGFDWAYGIAALATILLIGVFIRNTLKKGKLAWIFAALLGFFYLFIFVIIQLHDMALLVGSVGLFLSVAALMYFSSRINWQEK